MVGDAMAADMGASLLVVFNGLRLLPMPEESEPARLHLRCSLSQAQTRGSAIVFSPREASPSTSEKLE
jgi:hypothetical protein